MTEPITLRDAYRFFLPLVFMTELNMISKSVINAALARSEDQNVTLAAFHVGFTLYYALASSTEVSALLTLAYLKTRRALRRLLPFMVGIAVPSWILAQFIAFTPLGDWVFTTFFGVSEAVVVQAKQTTFLLSLSAPVLIVRSISFGLILMHRRTIFITIATVARLSSLGVSLVFLPWFLEGAAVGAAALLLCMTAESAVAFAFALRIFRQLPEGGEAAGAGLEAPPTFARQWRFSWPLMLNASAEMGVVTVISVFLGRLADPDQALAAFNIVYGLVSLIMSPLRNLVQTAQTLVRSAADRAVLNRFALRLIGVFAFLGIILFQTPLEDFLLAGAMGLEPELEAYCKPAFALAFLMAAAWAFSALGRGLLAGRRSTGMMAASGAARIAVAALVSTTTLVLAGANGAVVGFVAWMAGYGAEAALLAFRLRRLDRRGGDG